MLQWSSQGQLNELADIANDVPIEPLLHPVFQRAGIEVYLRRDDLIDPVVSGNKFYKLYYNLQEARAELARPVVSFGGAWSNHLHALAYASARLGLASAGLVSGWQPAPEKLSATLKDCQAWQMRLAFIPKMQYRNLCQQSGLVSELSDLLAEKLPGLSKPFIIPEGGGNLAGARGCMAITQSSLEHLEFSHLVSALGTGTSVAGMAAGLCKENSRVLVQAVPVIKSDDYAQVKQHIDSLWRGLLGEPSSSSANVELLTGFTDGGYGRSSDKSLLMIQELEQRYQCVGHPLRFDPVYTGKLIIAVLTLAGRHHWPRGSRLLLVHSGGLQGRRGFKQLG